MDRLIALILIVLLCISSLDRERARQELFSLMRLMNLLRFKTDGRRVLNTFWGFFFGILT